MNGIRKQLNPNIRNMILCQLGQQAGETVLTRFCMWVCWIFHIPLALLVLFLAAL